MFLSFLFFLISYICGTWQLFPYNCPFICRVVFNNSFPMSESLLAKTVKIAAVVTAYWIISISMVFLNKYLLSSPDLKLNAPLFVTWYQCVVTVICIYFLSFIGDRYPQIEKFPAFSIDLKVSRQILSLSVVFVGMITFNNLCLKFLGVSFYNVGRSLTTVFNVLFTYFVLGSLTSCKAILCCCVIVSGFLLGVNQEGSSGELSYAGVFFGVAASLCVSLNAIYTKRNLEVVDNNIWRLQLYNNFNAVFLFLPLMAAMGEFRELYNFPMNRSLYFWGVMTLSGFFGIAIGYVTGLQIKVTSPLTHNISGTAKACAQTIIAVFANDESKTSLWWLSNAFVIGGSGMYSKVRHDEMRSAANNAPNTRKTEPLSSSGSQNGEKV